MDFMESQRHSRHREAWDLLPWMINGTLTQPQLRRIEQHLEECERCRKECDSQRALRAQLCNNEVVLETPHAALRKLMLRIDQDMAAAVAPPEPRKSRRNQWLAAAVVIQAVGLIALGGFMSWKLNDLRQAPRYMTLSSAPVVTREGPVARVVFATAAPAGEIAALLHSFDAQIVAGPTDAGVYTVSLPKAPSVPTDVVSRLRDHPEVVFAELMQ